jgi:hypothetical protein
MENSIDRFADVCFTLSREDILELDKEDNGAIHNVISGINRNCFGVKLFDDQASLLVHMFFINNLNQLKGDIICLEIDDPEYFTLLLRFCLMIADDYEEIDAINAFNIFQTRLRSFLEKMGFFTTTTMELKMFEGKNAVGASSIPIKVIRLIDKVEFLRELFDNNYKLKSEEDREYVYLMVNEETSLIKIGTSIKPHYREKTLHSQEPKIFIIAVWCCDKALERELHKKYSKSRVRGEWFRLKLRELEEIGKFMNLKCNIQL